MAGGGRRKRGSQKKNHKSARQPAKEHSLYHPQNESPLSEELTALSAIFQEDFTLICEDYWTEFSIALHPHASGGRSNVSAELLVRCLPGYPYKPPKLQVKCEAGLSDEELQSLHSLLVDQAASISREGRVMVYNLVEAAQEYLSEHIQSDPSSEDKDDEEECNADEAVMLNGTANTLQHTNATPVYGFMDLFTELRDDLWTGESHHLKQKTLETPVGGEVRQNFLPLGDATVPALRKVPPNKLLSEVVSRIAEPQVLKPVKEAFPVVVGQEDGLGQGKARQCSSLPEILGTVYGALDHSIESVSNAGLSDLQDRSKNSVRKDFVLAHLLRLVCCPRGPLPHAWPDLALQLQKLSMYTLGRNDLNW